LNPALPATSAAGAYAGTSVDVLASGAPSPQPPVSVAAVTRATNPRRTVGPKRLRPGSPSERAASRTPRSRSEVRVV